MTSKAPPENNRVIRVALCQLNLHVGDIDGNLEKVRRSLARARDLGADLALFPELAVTGYPPEDLLLKPHFAESAEAALRDFAAEVQDIVAVLGFPELADDLFNTAAVITGGAVAATYRKRYLPNYGVFDEQRYFARGEEPLVLDMDGINVGVTICEDLWYPGGPGQRAVVDGGADVLVNIAASPYNRGKGDARERMLATRCLDYGCYLAFCNTIGGQDELVFDGHSLVIDPRGHVLARGKQFREDHVVLDLDLRGVSRRRLLDPRWRQRLTIADGVRVEPVRRSRREKPQIQLEPVLELLDPVAEVYQALLLGTSDYFRKNGFQGAVLGLSGGIDSALALTVAVDALGRDAVRAVFMPSRFTARASAEDAAELARRLGVSLIEIPIDELLDEYIAALRASFEGTQRDVAEENIQARIRGNLLMALSNKFGWLVLTTGNKSEMAVGYATLYGDMAGGFSILKDVLKTWVYQLARWRNACGEEVIPERILDRPPSAELREGQLDTDSLPPYDILDPIMEAYVEDDRSPVEIEKLGFDGELVQRIVKMIDGAEYKRRQAPPGIRISARAFGKDRRLPITNDYGRS